VSDNRAMTSIARPSGASRKFGVIYDPCLLAGLFSASSASPRDRSRFFSQEHLGKPPHD
jgi:hypothetical protein